MNCIIILVFVILVSIYTNPFTNGEPFSINFTAPDLNGINITYCIQWLPKERFKDAAIFLYRHCFGSDVLEDVAISLYGGRLNQCNSIYCFKNGAPDEIVGINLITIEKTNRFKKHGVFSEMFTWAVPVDPSYSNRGIERQLLKANDEFCDYFEEKFIVVYCGVNLTLQTIAHNLSYTHIDGVSSRMKYKKCPSWN